MSCGVGRRRGSDPTLLWLWRRPVATAPIQPLAWEPPYAVGKALKIKNKIKLKTELSVTFSLLVIDEKNFSVFLSLILCELVLLRNL